MLTFSCASACGIMTACNGCGDENKLNIIESNDGYDWKYNQNFVDEMDADMKIDGKLDEARWKENGKKWLTHTEKNVNMRYTTSFTAKGLYIAAEAKDTLMQWNETRDFANNSSFYFYIISENATEYHAFDCMGFYVDELHSACRQNTRFAAKASRSVDENGFKARIIDWVKRGGVWIVGPMTDIMNGNVSKYTDAPYGFLEELAGVYTKYQKPIDNDVFKAKWNDGETCSVGGCFDAYECKEGTNSLANYSEGEFAPFSVITERAVGKGKVILAGSVISEKDLLKLVDRKPIAEASNNIALVERCGGYCGIIAAEIENKDGFIVLDGEYTDLISGKQFCGRVDIMPYGVFVFVK